MKAKQISWARLENHEDEHVEEQRYALSQWMLLDRPQPLPLFTELRVFFTCSRKAATITDYPAPVL